MRKIISLMHISLDGFAARSDGDLSWIIIDPELFSDVKHFLNDVDATIYGRVTYQLMESYWPFIHKNPDATKDELEHADWYAKVQKNVFSNTLPQVTSENTRVFNGHFLDEVQKLKNSEGQNIMIFGSPSLTHQFMKHSLIDEYRLTIQPVLLGKGIRFFIENDQQQKLERTYVKVYQSGVIAVNYKPNLND
ncbi:MAG: dihydrofolate reductase [Ignavibacteriales bacterium]|nr:dihydrofolate reductase [Ignavibacteriales bacterium]